MPLSNNLIREPSDEVVALQTGLTPTDLYRQQCFSLGYLSFIIQFPDLEDKTPPGTVTTGRHPSHWHHYYFVFCVVLPRYVPKSTHYTIHNPNAPMLIPEILPNLPGSFLNSPGDCLTFLLGRRTIKWETECCYDKKRDKQIAQKAAVGGNLSLLIQRLPT